MEIWHYHETIVKRNTYINILDIPVFVDQTDVELARIYCMLYVIRNGFLRRRTESNIRSLHFSMDALNNMKYVCWY